MGPNGYLTTGQISQIAAEPEWRVRRVVDSLDADIPRAGLYRIVPRDLLPIILQRLAEHSEPQATGS